MDWSELSIDERLVLPNVSEQIYDPVDKILRRVRASTPLTSGGQHRDFGERRLRNTLRSLEARNLVVRRYRSSFALHIEGRTVMDRANVRTGLRRRVT